MSVHCLGIFKFKACSVCLLHLGLDCQPRQLNETGVDVARDRRGSDDGVLGSPTLGLSSLVLLKGSQSDVITQEDIVGV